MRILLNSFYTELRIAPDLYGLKIRFFHMKRSVDISVVSDAHLGTYGCHAEELLSYLRSVRPKILILNGDFIDGWQFRKKYFPRTHLEVIHEVIQMAIQGVKVYYITGNHDDFLRKFSDIDTGPDPSQRQPDPAITE